MAEAAKPARTSPGRLFATGTCWIFPALLLWPMVLGQRLYWGDLLLYFGPMYNNVARQLRGGRIPLWNPLVLGGQPLLGNPQMGIFFPATAVLMRVSAWTAITIFGYLSIGMAATFMYRYLRRWTHTRAAALTGALTYAGSAALVGRLQFPPMALTIGLAPLAFEAVDRLVDTPNLRHGLLTAGAVALIVLAAHPQAAYLFTLLLLFYGSARVWAASHEAERRGLKAIQFAISRAAAYAAWGFLGICIAAMQWLPTLQLMLESPRERMTEAQANRFVLHPVQLLTYLWPKYVGSPVRGDFWAPGNPWEAAVFVGWLPLTFVVISLFAGDKRRVKWFWFAGWATALWLAFGRVAGLYTVAFYGVPGVARFHDPARFLLIGSFALSALAAFGADHTFMRWPAQRAISAGAVILTAVPMLWFGRSLLPMASNHRLQEAVRRLPIPAAGRVYSMSSRALWDRYLNYASYGDAAAPTIQNVLAAGVPNTGMLRQSAEASGYEPVPVLAASELDGAIRRLAERSDPAFANELQLANVTTIIGVERVVNPDLGDARGFGAETQRVMQPSHAFWLAASEICVPNTRRAIAVTTSPQFRPSAVAVVTGARGAFATQNESATPVGSVTVPPGQFNEDRIRLCVNVTAPRAVLLCSRTAYPGWRAWCDGKPTPVFRADISLLAVEVPNGKHDVVLRYAPFVYRLGLYISAVSVLVAASAAAFWLCAGARLGKSENAGK
ncbi:MAG: YfhO family protein [Armatimonadetes bacterium]|nr:YfhO family protein [Armatimonadota bacterium]MDE2205432.1 YfhO family protein [Armatimonadota bacterium]